VMNTVFCDVPPCSLVEIYRRFTLLHSHCLLGLLLGPGDGDSRFLRNVGKVLSAYMVSYPGRYYSDTLVCFVLVYF
jgi:hypothetical protein